MNFLVWNIHRNNIYRHVAEVVSESDASFIVLVEPPSEEEQHDFLNSLFLEFKDYNRQNYTRINCGGDFIILVDSNRFGQIEEVYLHHDRRMSVFLCQDLIGDCSFLISAVHVPSKLHMSEMDQNIYCLRLFDKIDDQRRRFDDAHLIVVGDFNLDPFEMSLLNKESFNATRSLSRALNASRLVGGCQKDYFFNPCWKLIMNDNEASGTYFYSKGYVDYRWHVFDQVLIGRTLLENYLTDSLSVLKQTTNYDLSRNGKPDHAISDHYPLTFGFEI